MKNKIIFKTLMLKGEAGSTIVSMEKTGHVGTADIYTITFNDGSTTEISLENMSAITSVEKTSSTDTEDIYTITCADGSTQTFSVLNHNADVAAMSDDIDTIDARVDNFINSVVPNTVETLWTGSIKEVGDSATLSKAVSNFDYIDLYLLGSADSKYIRVPATQTAVEIQQQNMSDDASSNFLRLWEMGVSISGTTVSITKSIAWAWDDPDNSNPTVTANAQNGVPITRIDGVKVASDTPAELLDIRVGADGTTYNSAGAAVRGQISDLNEKLNAIAWFNLFDSSAVVSGGYYSSTGTVTTNANSEYSTQYIKVKNAESYKWSTTAGQIQIVTYDSSKTFIERLVAPAQGSGYTFGSGVAFVRISNYAGNLTGFVFATATDFTNIPTGAIASIDGAKLSKGSISYNHLDNTLKSKIDNITFLDSCFEQETAYVPVDLSHPNRFNSETVAEVYGEIVSATPKRLRLTSGSVYNSFVFITTEELSVYFDSEAISATGYLAIATLANPSDIVEDANGDYYYSLTGADPVRYRKSDNNLPSSVSPLTIGSGYLVVVTYQTNLTIPNATLLYVQTTTVELAEKVELQEGQVTKFFPKPKKTVKKTGDSFEICNGNAKYYVNYYNNSSIRANLWRTNRCDIKKPDGTYFTLWNNSDSDGVVSLNGEDDFIGGYHGDETQTLIKMYVDGVEVEPSSTFAEKEYNEIVMIFTSNVYHCNTSPNAANIAFVRNKILLFNNEGYTIKNHWIAQENLEYKLAYMGMLSVERYQSDGETALINGYYTNDNYLYKNNATATERSNKITEAHFVTAYGDAYINYTFPDDMQNNRGHVQDYDTEQQQRLKAYFGFGYGTAIALSSGDVLQASVTIRI